MMDSVLDSLPDNPVTVGLDPFGRGGFDLHDDGIPMTQAAGTQTYSLQTLLSDPNSLVCDSVLSHPDNGVEGEAYEPPAFSYDEIFPALPESTGADPQKAANLGQWTQRMKMNSSIITQVFRVPVEERRFKEAEQFGGGQGEQAKRVLDIMQLTGTHIEISSSKDQSLTILVTGKQDAVVKARRQIVNALQMQANMTIVIPKEHHRFILGKNGKKLKELELLTATKISVPRPEDNSDHLSISGTKENIDKARHEIQLISDEQAKLAFERFEIPKIYHPFIVGAHGENLSRISNETNVRVNIPPVSVMKDEITIAGEKDGVARAKEIIVKLYEEKKRRCQTVSINVKKSQHKYIIGARGQTLQEILAQTGVSVEMPPLDSQSETITLRGEHDKLGPALTLVYAKANSVEESEIPAPSWLHKYIIGRKGANIREITQDLPKVHVEFRDDENKIKIEGPPDEVEQARVELEKVTQDLMSRYTFDVITVDPKYHRHIIGKQGANVNRIKSETGVVISIAQNEGSNIRIEGERPGVMHAKQELLEMVSKLENERSKDIIIDQRFHRTIIGTKGEKIREIRDKFNQVNVTFPDPGVKSDVVTIRGPKQDVDQCYKYLFNLNKELIENNYKIEVPIYKHFHKNIIGKGGANIKKIRDETGTRIELPAEGSESDTIVIIGKKANAEQARDRIQQIQNELVNVVSADLTIPAKYHNSIIGAKGRLVRAIMDECGGVRITFPAEGTGSDKVNIRGPRDDVERAKKQLMELFNEKQLSSFTVEIKAKPELHKFLIGKNGANIKKVKDKTGARVSFPTDKDDDRESIVIIGKKEDVMAAKAELETLIKDLEKVVECTVKVDPKYHRHFVQRRGQLLREIADEFGGVAVSFPRGGAGSDVTLKGAKECVELAMQRILQVVSDLEQMVTIECIIPQKNHRTVMGAKGSKVQGITQEFNVNIKFPDKDAQDEDAFQMNGDMNGDEIGSGEFLPADDRPKKNDIIRITGKSENCEKAKEALLALVPIVQELNVPFDYHRFLIGQRGKDVRELMETYDVNITLPPAEHQLDIIKISGSPSSVEAACEAIQNRVDDWEKQKQYKILRSFSVTVEVEPKYHPKIIGNRGNVISKIRKEHDVQVQFPDRGDPNSHIITIKGCEKNCHDAKEAILRIITDLVTTEVNVDHRVHSRLIGVKGRSIRKIMDEYKVDIKFPRDTDPNPNLVIIMGQEDNVLDAKDHLLNLEEEYLQSITDNEYMKQYTLAPSRNPNEENNRNANDNPGFVVKGGPWEQKPKTSGHGSGGGGGGPSVNSLPPPSATGVAAPDTSSNLEFPSFGSSDAPKPIAKPIAWGPRR